MTNFMHFKVSFGKFRFRSPKSKLLFFLNNNLVTSSPKFFCIDFTTMPNRFFTSFCYTIVFFSIFIFSCTTK